MITRKHHIERPWTDGEIEYLKAARERGESFLQISKTLLRSRNSVAGKCDRLGLSKPRDAA